MITSAELRAAVAEGVISAQQADALEAFVARKPKTAPGGEEDLRFIRNFHDIFLSIGIIILGVGLAIAVNLGGGADVSARFVLTGLACAGAYWLMAEYFARRRRLFLPAITLAAGFVGFCVTAVGGLAGPMLIENAGQARNLAAGGRQAALFWMALSGAGMAASAAFILRFRLPFAWALFAISASFGALGGLAYVVPLDQLAGLSGPIILTTGVATFLAALAFDARDPTRMSLSSDNAFWLHLAAAPQILQGALATTLGWSQWTGDAHAAIVALVIVAVLGLISLAINRRALLVSALTTIGIAVYALVDNANLTTGAAFAFTLIALGGGVVLLGAAWHSARRLLLAPVPKSGLIARVFPPEATA